MEGARTIYLWPDGSPNNPSDGRPRPSLTVYPPAGVRGPCAAVVVLPGGGYSHLAPHEAEPVGRYFAGHGLVGAVCTYRVSPDRFPAPMADAARAVRLVRSRAAELGVDPRRVALMGFSAGGHLAAVTATRPDLHVDPEDDLAAAHAARPDRLILAYPVISMTRDYHVGSTENLLGANPSEEARRALSVELHVTHANPPAFVFHTADDPAVPASNSLRFALACLAGGVPCEVHLYRSGRHGVGLATEEPALAGWPRLLLDWLADWRPPAAP